MPFKSYKICNIFLNMGLTPDADADADAVTPSSHQELHTSERFLNLITDQGSSEYI